MNITKDIKQDLIAEIEKRVADKILEQADAKLLIKLIKNADSTDEAMDIATMGTIYKKTGLHFSPRLEPKRDNTIRYFKKNETLSFQTDKTRPTHKLIIGDNYPALQNLLIQYKGKVDVIYIDPPYGKDKMGEFAKTNYNNAITRDNLLSMLYPRLILARQLLSESGVIFCSIDDRNQAYIKCLFDEVFGEENFVANMVRVAKAGGGHDSKYLSIEYDYILLFGKNIEQININKEEVDADNDRKYKLTDRYVERRGKYYLRDLDFIGSYSARLDYPIKLQSGKEIYPGGKFGKPNTWRWSKEKYQWGLENDFIVIDEQKEKIYIKQYQFVDNEDNLYERKIPYRAMIQNLNSEGAKENTSLFHTKNFDNPKPIKLIKHILEISSSPNSIILDFFAGSGTTGHAVLDLNKQDGGNRTFILCQLNEITDENPNGVALDVTSKRLKRIMTGKCYDNSTDFEWIKKNTPYGDNLDVYDIASVADFENTKGKTPFDVIDETLYGKEKFKTKKEKIEWVCQNFDHTQKVLEE